MIEIENINKTFIVKNKQYNIFNNLSISFEDFGLTAIVGPSGSGKTTLMNMITGLDRDFTGNIKFNNLKIDSLFIKNSVSYLMQDDNLFTNATIYKNLKMYNEVDEETIDTLLKKLGVFHLKNKKISKLSGGEKRRVSLAKALLKKPKILVCDEPTSSLDYQNSVNIMKILKDISKDILVIYSSHDEQLVEEYSNSIYVINEKNISIRKFESCRRDNIKNDIPYTISNEYRKFSIINTLFNEKKVLFSRITILSLTYIILLFCFSIANHSIAHIQTETMRKESDNTMLISSNDLDVCNIYNKDNNSFLNLINHDSTTESYYYILPPNYCFYTYDENTDYGEIIGNIPKIGNEIMIYQITAEDLVHYGLYRVNSEVYYPKSINELINKEILLDGEKFVISGIIKQDLEPFNTLKNDKDWISGINTYEYEEKFFGGKILSYSGMIITSKDTISHLNSIYQINEVNYARYDIKEEIDYNNIEEKLNQIEPHFKLSNIIKNKYLFYVNGTHYSNSISNLLYGLVITSMIIKKIIPLIIIIIFIVCYLFIKNLLERNSKNIAMMKIDGIGKKDIAFSFYACVVIYSLISFIISYVLFNLLSKIICIYLSKKYYFYLNIIYLDFKNYIYFVILIILLCLLSTILIIRYFNKMENIKYLKNNRS